LAEKLSPETHKPPKLTAFNCAQIGLYALHKEYYHVAIELIDYGIDKVVFEFDESIPLTSLENYLELAVKAVGAKTNNIYSLR
jgi:hypothetical protein